MDLLSTILACSLYLEDDGLVRAIAESNSQSNPYFVLDASIDSIAVDPALPPKTMEAAVARVQDIAAHGGRPVVGLMQLAPAWMQVFGRELRDAFDPCENVAVGSAMLSQFDYECGLDTARPAAPARSSGPPAPGTHPRRTCVLAKYEDAIGLPDLVTLTTLELRYQRAPRGDVAAAPIFASPVERAWGPDRLLVSITPRFIGLPPP